MEINELDALIFDFDGVLTDNKVYVDQNGNESVCCSRSDGLAFDALTKMGIPVYILSTEANPVVAARGRKLSVPVIQGSSNKLISLKNLCDENGYSLKNILFSGNDLNDFEVMKHCGFSACPADSHSKIIRISNFVLSSKGGEGFVRELLEKVLKINLLDVLTGVSND